MKQYKNFSMFLKDNTFKSTKFSRGVSGNITSVMSVFGDWGNDTWFLFSAILNFVLCSQISKN